MRLMLLMGFQALYSHNSQGVSQGNQGGNQIHHAKTTTPDNAQTVPSPQEYTKEMVETKAGEGHQAEEQKKTIQKGASEGSQALVPWTPTVPSGKPTPKKQEKIETDHHSYDAKNPIYTPIPDYSIDNKSSRVSVPPAPSGPIAQPVVTAETVIPYITPYIAPDTLSQNTWQNDAAQTALHSLTVDDILTQIENDNTITGNQAKQLKKLFHRIERDLHNNLSSDLVKGALLNQLQALPGSWSQQVSQLDNLLCTPSPLTLQEIRILIEFFIQGVKITQDAHHGQQKWHPITPDGMGMIFRNLPGLFVQLANKLEKLGPTINVISIFNVLAILKIIMGPQEKSITIPHDLWPCLRLFATAAFQRIHTIITTIFPLL